MKKNLLGLAAVAALAAASMGSVSPAAQETQVTPQTQRQVEQGAIKPTKATQRSTVQLNSGYGSGSRGSERRRGPGWTHAHVQRMARKKRNQARHRKACR